MDEIVECEGKHFTRSYKKSERDPFRVECIETGEIAYDHDSFENATENVLQKNSFGNEMQTLKYADKAYICRIFQEALLHQKKSACNKLIEGKMLLGDLPMVSLGDTTEYTNKDDENVKCIHYYTGAFDVYALMDSGLAGGITKIEINER